MGSRILYYGVLKPISFLPFPVLYLLSDFLFLLMFYVAGYRKKVVIDNIDRSFPNKTKMEKRTIARKFYRHFCDLVVESIKGFSISEKQLRKRMIFENPELFQEFFENGQDLIVVGAHFNNWEWCGFATPFYLQHIPLGIYSRLSNPFFEKKMKKSREKFGLQLCTMAQTRRRIGLKEAKPKITFFITDQSPHNLNSAHWMEFLNQDTPVFTGAERYAKAYNLPIVFGGIQKTKRGHYRTHFKLLFNKPAQEKPFHISEQITREIEAQIKKQPEFWLWTHKRWKRKRKADA